MMDFPGRKVLLLTYVRLEGNVLMFVTRLHSTAHSMIIDEAVKQRSSLFVARLLFCILRAALNGRHTSTHTHKHTLILTHTHARTLTSSELLFFSVDSISC